MDWLHDTFWATFNETSYILKTYCVLKVLRFNNLSLAKETV